jgi:glycosyltransferase involved in cell wall biosynthesis
VAELKGKVANPHVGERLTAFDPDVVQIYGYYHTLFRDVMTWARKAGRPVLYWSDSELLTRVPLWKRVIKRIILPRLFARCAAFLTIGDCNDDHYRRYGVPSNRLFRSPYPIDDIRLTQAVEARDEARRQLLEKFDLPGDAIIALVVGKLTVRKAPHHAIRAVSQVWKSGFGNRLFLILAGNGPERGNLETLAAECEPAAIRFAGFVEVSELPSYYAGADLLVHPKTLTRSPPAKPCFAGFR